MSTFYNPSMMQYQAAQGMMPQQYGGSQQPAQSSYNPQGGMAQSPVYGSQSNSMVGSGQIDPYMLDTFGYGGYYQQYGNQQSGMQNQTPVPQQPYYQVPTEYIPEGTPGLGQQAQQQQQQQANYMRSPFDNGTGSGTGWNYTDLSTGKQVNPWDLEHFAGLYGQFGDEMYNTGYDPYGGDVNNITSSEMTNLRRYLQPVAITAGGGA